MSVYIFIRAGPDLSLGSLFPHFSTLKSLLKSPGKPLTPANVRVENLGNLHTSVRDIGSFKWYISCIASQNRRPCLRSITPVFCRSISNYVCSYTISGETLDNLFLFFYTIKYLFPERRTLVTNSVSY